MDFTVLYTQYLKCQTALVNVVLSSVSKQFINSSHVYEVSSVVVIVNPRQVRITVNLYADLYMHFVHLYGTLKSDIDLGIG